MAITPQAAARMRRRAGYPNINVPAGFVFGMPIGISFFGPGMEQPTLLKLPIASNRLPRPEKYRSFCECEGLRLDSDQKVNPMTNRVAYWLCVSAGERLGPGCICEGRPTVDTDGGAVQSDQNILIRDGKVEAVGKASPSSRAKVVTLSSMMIARADRLPYPPARSAECGFRSAA